MKYAYKEWTPQRNSVGLVLNAEEIINEYQSAGYTLTLRQLYYQFVARGIIENSDRNYKNLGNVITKARLAGLISWTAIEDRNRGHNSFWYDEDIMNPIRSLPRFIRFDRWKRQDYYVEVWVEKEALGNVVSRACEPYLVPHLSCKGYLSASEAWRAGRRFREKIMQGKECIMIHLGDHDPSGIDMTRDNTERLELFSEFDEYITVKRIALNMDQVEEYSPPPNPAKLSDSRAKEYIKKYGRTSWELDALEPSVMEEMITTEIERYIDFNSWDSIGEQEEEVCSKLAKLGDKWEEIEDLL